MASSNQEAEVPVMQVLEKAHYFTQALVPVPATVPYPPSPRRPRSASGPASSPSPTTTAWGWAEVLDSSLPQGGPGKGDFVFGYLPLATLAQDVEFRVDEEVAGHLVATSAYRARLMPFYNRYFTVDRNSDVAAQLRASIEKQQDQDPGNSNSREASVVIDDCLGFDALFYAIFECGHLVAQYMFDARDPVHPGLGPDAPAQTPWTKEMADLAGATVVLLAPASKTALGMAYELQRKKKGGADGGPKRVVGAASEASRDFVQGTGLYDVTVSTTAETPDAEFLRTKLGVDAGAGDKVILIDCGGRAGVGKNWAAAFRKLCRPGRFLLVGIGSEAGEHSPEDVLKLFAPKEDEKEGKEEKPWFIQVNTGDLRERAAARDGRKAVFEGDGRGGGGVRGFRVRWGVGMEAVAGGWERLGKGETRAEEGMAFLL
ncbi:hypothetical protein PG994_006718 [Apiospora phragmitis]|uniref:Uncharacterized protein n=1 Tax=Apiospora phragmitis TaxID=2905665 RepID=A0ABR1VGV8_9PEZI